MVRFILILSIVLLTTLGFYSWVKEKIDTGKFDPSIKLDADLAVPLGYLNLRISTMQDSGKGRIFANSERILSVCYSDSMITPPADSLLHAGNIRHTFHLTNDTDFPVDLSKAELDTTLKLLLPFNIEAGGIPQQIDSISILRGEFSTGNNSLPFNGELVTLSFAGIHSVNSRFSAVISSMQTQTTYDLADHTITTAGEVNSMNMIEVEVSILIPRQDRIIEPGDLLANLDLQLNLEKWGMIWGYQGKTTLPLSLRSFNVTYSRDLPSGEYWFTRPSIRMITSNSFGIPLGLGFKSFSGFTQASGTISLNGAGMPLLPDYFYPAYSHSPDPLLSTKDSILIDNSNSNLADLINKSVRTFIYQPVLVLGNDDENSSGFISRASALSVLVDLELPFSGYAGKIILEDTTTFEPDVFRMNGADDIHEAKLNLYYENSFPAEISLSLYIADENFMITDVLFSKPVLIEGAPPTDKWQDDPPFRAGDLNISISPDILRKPDGRYYLIASAEMNTSEMDREVNFFDNQSLVLKAGIIVNLQKETDTF